MNSNRDRIGACLTLRHGAATPLLGRKIVGLPDGALQPGYSGIRPKLQSPTDKSGADFIIQGPEGHGVAGLVNLYGIESPGLTASLALADEVTAKLGR